MKKRQKKKLHSICVRKQLNLNYEIVGKSIKVMKITS